VVDERRTERSRGGGELDKFGSIGIGGDEIGSVKIGSEVASSAQLTDDGGAVEVIRVGLGVGPGCGDICELASCVPGEMVCMMALTVHGVNSVVVGISFGVST